MFIFFIVIAFIFVLVIFSDIDDAGCFLAIILFVILLLLFSGVIRIQY